MTLDPSTPLGPPSTPAEPPRLPGRLWLWALVAGLLAATAGGLGGEPLHDHFQPDMTHPPGFDKLGPYEKPDVLSAMVRKQAAIVGTKNTAATYGLLGAALGGALGFAAGLARRSPALASRGGLIGGLAGAAGAAGMSALLVPIFFRTLDPESGLLHSLLIHAGIWVPIGVAAGLGFGFGLGDRRSIGLAVVGGLAGAALGTMAFEIAASLAFPNARMDRPIPETAAMRHLADFCVATFTALGVALALGERKPKAVAEVRPVD